MKKTRRTGGYTLVEMMVAMSITAFIGAGGLAMTISALRCQDNVGTQTFTDTDAVIALQTIDNDVREAKAITIVNSGNLQITFPIRTGTWNQYDRHTPDPNNIVNYYLSDSTGATNKTGTYLWKGLNGAAQKIVKRDVSSLAFAQDANSASGISITITTQNAVSRSVKQTNLTHREVYLRNY